MRIRRFLALGLFASNIAAGALSLEKAKSLHANGLLDEAKHEFIEVAFAETSSRTDRAQAFLALGQIALAQGNRSGARENFRKVVSDFSESAEAAEAGRQLSLLGHAPTEAAEIAKDPEETSYATGSVLVVSDPDFPWASVPLGAALGSMAVSFAGTLAEAQRIAQSDKNVAGVIEVLIDTDSVHENAQVICYRKDGRQIWEEKELYLFYGNEERIARNFVEKLSKKMKKRRCP